jgi:hypothetical protein
MTSGTVLFRQARDTLIGHRTDYQRAVAAFSWPSLQQFNWALDWFDVIARGDQRTARSLGMRRPQEFWEEDFIELRRDQVRRCSFQEMRRRLRD